MFKWYQNFFLIPLLVSDFQIFRDQCGVSSPFLKLALDSGHRPDIQYYIMRDPSESGLITNFKGELLPEPRSGHSCTKIKCLKNRASFFVYGGIGMLNTPLNDAWILEISDYGLEVTWTPYTLAYDHGQVRCLHAGDFKIQQLK